MGDPKKQRKKFSKPGHPWEGARINEEKGLTREYGLSNKTEIWRMRSVLRTWQKRAREIISLSEEERKRESEKLISTLNSMAILEKDATLDSVLALKIREVMERRLQTLVYKQGFANTIRQGRQFITHGKIMVDGKTITSPSVLLKISNRITYTPKFNPIIKKIIKKPVAEKPVEAKIENGKK